jgi:hypothetical protein
MAFRIGRLAVATLRLAAAMATTLILPAAAAKAEPVSINRNRGQGFAVSHNGNCYVILPAHVHGRGTALTLSTGSPPIVGAASVFQSFMPGMDLSVAYVSGGLDGRCGDRFADLPRNIDPLIGPGGAVSFVRVSAAGQIERVPARVTSLLYETMEIEVAEGETATVFRGTSGAFVFAGDTPVGMIIRAPDDRHAEVLRIDAIAARLDRLLAGGIGAAPEEPVAAAPSQSEGGIGLSGLAAGITRCSAEPATPETSCWAMAEGSSPLIVPADSVPFVIEIDLAGEESVPVSVVTMKSDAAAGDTTTPRTVLVERTTAAGDRPAWRSYGRGDMSPLGSLEVRHGAAPRAGAIRITVLSVWKSGLPLRIDAIGIE